MKKQTLNYLVISILVMLFQNYSSNAQTIFHQDDASSKLRISGTSSLHDWDMNVEKFDCSVAIKSDGEDKISVQSVDFKCQVNDLKSHNKIMDKKTHGAFDPDHHPEIKFVTENNAQVVNDTLSTIKGELFISGVKKEINLNFSKVSKNEDQFIVKGNIPLKMSDFGIDPPTAMMGTLKTGDDIVIHYEVLFRNAQLGSLTD